MGAYDPPYDPNRDEPPCDQRQPERVSDAVRLVREGRARQGRSPCCGAQVKVDEVSGRKHCRACLEWLDR